MALTDSLRGNMNFRETRTQVFAALGALAAAISIFAFVQEKTDERFQCWDRSLATRKSDCPALHGSSGLFWLFPSLASTAASDCELTVPVKGRKTAVYVCNFEAIRDRYLIRYTAWTDSESAFDYYDDQYAEEPTALALKKQRVGDEWVTSTYLSPRGMPFKRSGYFYGAPFSWSVEASSPIALARGRSELDIRAVDNWTFDRELGFWTSLKHGLSP